MKNWTTGKTETPEKLAKRNKMECFKKEQSENQ